MKLRKFVTPAAAAAAFVAIILAAMLNTPPRVRATGDDDDNGNDSRIQRGLDIAPVHLNFEGKNRALVGIGSYIVNAAVPCNECHGAGPALNQFVPGDNPYFGQTAVIDSTTYLGGGRNFGAPVPGSAVIFSRNLTPDKTGPARRRPHVWGVCSDHEDGRGLGSAPSDLCNRTVWRSYYYHELHSRSIQGRTSPDNALAWS
jgi:hypothetical protein